MLGCKSVMLDKNQKLLLRLPILLLSCLLFQIQAVYSAPIALEDRVMDQVTAGNTNEGGGVVVGKSSEAIANRISGLDLNSEAQKNATGLNIINSAESAVANVVNIWDGSGVTATKENSDTNSELRINQVNNITQEQLRSATISGYVRSQADYTETLNRSGSVAYASNIVDHHSVTNILEETHESTIFTNAGVNTHFEFKLGEKIEFSGHLGLGIAAAGHTDITFKGGSADIGLALDGTITTAGNNKPLTAEGGLVLVTQVELPDMRLIIDGVGCGVAIGSCNADSISFETINTKTDNSTLDRIENHQSGQSSYSEVQASVYRSPFELKSARAEYIVIDDSTIELNSDVTLELSESAQKDAKGMNIVNAIGSTVANGTNLTRTRSFEGSRSKLVLNQFNTVHHGN